jgi:hypothetical protein
VRSSLLSILLVLTGCVPALDGAEQVLIYDYVDGSLMPVERPLNIPAADLVAGRSSRTDILIGGEVVVQNAGIRVQGGRVPELPARVEDGVLIPGDGDALSFFSFLVHLDTAAEWYLERGMAEQRLFDGLESRYEVYLPFATEWRNLADNAGYFPPTHDFLLGPSEIVPGAPVMASPGVVGHELGHAVQVRTGDAESLRWDCLGVDSRASCRTINGMDEGLSDLWAVGIWGDPNFVGRNFGDLVAERDLRDLKAMETWLFDLTDSTRDVEEMDVSEWDPHLPGAIWASWWWAIGEELGDFDRAIELSWDLVRGVGQLREDDVFGVVEMSTFFLGGATDAERTAACPVFEAVMDAEVFEQVIPCG